MRRPTQDFLTSVFLTTGNMIGVGLLAVPVLLGLTGFWPGLLIMALIAALVWISGYAIAARIIALRRPDGDLPSLYGSELGGWSRWIVIPAYLLMFYGVLTAYLAGAGSMLSTLVYSGISVNVWIIIVFLTASSFFAFGQSIMLRMNSFIVSVLVLVFIALVAVSSVHVRAVNFTHCNWGVAPFTLPVLCCAFTYHNVIPSVCKKNEWRGRMIHMALLTGLLIAVFMTAAWFFVVVGSLPFSDDHGGPSLVSAFNQGKPATVPLAELVRSPLVTIFGLIFSLLAILTSYLGVGVGLSSFLRDLVPALRPTKRGPLVFCATFLPPLLITLLYPSIFLDMVDVVGGLGTIILFGLLPILSFVRRTERGRRMTKVIMIGAFALFLCIFVLEAGKVLGVIHMDIEKGITLESTETRAPGARQNHWHH